MESLLLRASELVILAVDALALVIVAGATAKLVLDLARHVLFARATSAHETRAIWLDYARWLVAALTLQLAADIVESAIAPSWEDIAKLGAVAVIRTFLNYFLERDIREVREMQGDALPGQPDGGEG